jgi:hypothetical protein
MPYRFFRHHDEQSLLDRQYLLMEEFGVYIPLETIDMRHLIHLSDRANKDRMERNQRNKMKDTLIRKHNVRGR